MARIRMLVGVAGPLGDMDSPGPGTIVTVDETAAKAWCDGPDPRAERVEDPKPGRRAAGRKTAAQSRETATAGAHETTG